MIDPYSSYVPENFFLRKCARKLCYKRNGEHTIGFHPTIGFLDTTPKMTVILVCLIGI